METGGGDGDGRRQATGDEGDDERRAAGGGRRATTTKTTMATDERKQRRSGRAKAKMVGRCRAMGEEWKGKGEDGRSLSGLLPVRAMGEELRGARRARHQKVSEFRILKIRTRGA